MKSNTLTMLQCTKAVLSFYYDVAELCQCKHSIKKSFETLQGTGVSELYSTTQLHERMYLHV